MSLLANLVKLVFSDDELRVREKDGRLWFEMYDNLIDQEWAALPGDQV
jgi:hypothetical protein